MNLASDSSNPSSCPFSASTHSEFCAANDIRYWNDFGKDELKSYGVRLCKRYSPRSQCFELTEAKTVLNWLMDEKHLPRESAFRFRLSKPDGSDAYCYTHDQVVGMLELCDEDASLQWLGDIVRVLACTGV